MAEKQKLGVLLLHGYTSSLDTVNGLVPTLEQLGLPYKMPLLRGHGTHHRDLKGVTWRDWYADAAAALDEVLRQAQRVVVVGLSMGGLVTINLGIERAKDLAGIALASPALDFSNPLARFSRPISRVVGYMPMVNSIRDPELAKLCTNYSHLESGSFASLYEYSKLTMARAPLLKLPLLVVHSRHDQVIPPAAVEKFLSQVGTPREKLAVHWLKQSGHEIMQDSEKQDVFDTIGAWLKGFM